MGLRACCHSPDIYKNKIWPLPWQVYSLMPCLFQNLSYVLNVIQVNKSL